MDNAAQTSRVPDEKQARGSGAYSDWQVRRLRERLSAYHKHEPGRSRNTISWDEISEDLRGIMGVHIPGETLRQFVEPSNKKEKKAPRKPDNERLDAIKGFLMHESVGYLTQHDMTEEVMPFHAAFAMMEFFGHSQEPGAPSNLPQLSGNYEAEKEQEGTREVIQLFIDCKDSDGLIRVREQSQMFMFTEDGEENEDTLVTSGWGAYHPQGMFLIFLRDPQTLNVHCYLTVVSQPDLGFEEPVSGLLCYFHDQSVECNYMTKDLPGQPEIELTRLAMQDYKENTMIFRKLA